MCPHHNLFLYKTLSKSRTIKTFEMDRRKPQWRLRILILLQQMRRIKQPNQKKKKHCWVRDIFKNRGLGAFKTLFHEMRNDRELFFRYFAMSLERFDHLHTLVREQIEKKDTVFRKSFSAASRLAITIRYLTSGETQQSLSYRYRIGRSTVSTVIAETCKAIYTALKDRYLKSTSTEDDRKAIAVRFEEVWLVFPACFRSGRWKAYSY